MIETCCLPRLVRIGGKGYSLTPPTIRQALEILHVLDHLEEEEDVHVLIDLVCKLDWSPSMSVNRGLLFGMMKSNPIHLTLLLHKALTQGYEPKKIEQGLSEAKGTSNKKVNWNGLLENYRDTYGGDAWTVYNTVPFTFFLEKLKTLSVDRAKKAIHEAVKYSPSKKTIEGWQNEVKGGDKEYGPVVSLTPEEIEKSKALSENKLKIGK